MVHKIGLTDFMKKMSDGIPVLDVRSPGEFAHAHVPGAHSMPLFSDEERKRIGTAYKQQSREAAVRIGLEYFGKDLLNHVDSAKSIAADGEVLVHCWRGGMRSAAVAWLLDLYGFRVNVLIGGYKAYRRWAIEKYSEPFNLRVLGGYTGSGKTLVLQALKNLGKQVVDLEGIAGHLGSAFGNLNNLPQPSQEMFENLLAAALSQLDPKRITWVEAESQRIGDVNIPGRFFDLMKASELYFLDIPFEERLKNIVASYGHFPRERMADAIVRITRRLGGLETRNALAFLDAGNIHDCFAILLRYYDRLYLKSKVSSQADRHVTHLTAHSCDVSQNVSIITAHAST